MVFTALLQRIYFGPFFNPMRQRVICKGTSEEHVKQKKGGVRLRNSEKDLTKVDSTIVFFMYFEWSGL